jgi:hypothetical protein
MLVAHRPAVGRVEPAAAITQGNDVIHFGRRLTAASDAACRPAPQEISTKDLPLSVVASLHTVAT